ncbi:hypothetical protein B0T10DRAFT_498761 [Thelonectria olida]|uniref:BPTI/Kunitz inhibitor domain-containing protein n=1 Tax=Thelonectria olida TaxID=1576542 RepID=A0A9P8VTP0_9HYPO|nr:hypothetical protein B0T10DRAFT_498761 [Thelonectria olida]
MHSLIPISILQSYFVAMAVGSVIPDRSRTDLQSHECWEIGGRRMIRTINSTWIKDQEACLGDNSSFLKLAVPGGDPDDNKKQKRNSNCSGTTQPLCQKPGGGCGGQPLAGSNKYYYDPVTTSCRIFQYSGCAGNGNFVQIHEESSFDCNGNTLHINGYSDRFCEHSVSVDNIRLTAGDHQCAAQLAILSYIAYAS